MEWLIALVGILCLGGLLEQHLDNPLVFVPLFACSVGLWILFIGHLKSQGILPHEEISPSSLEEEVERLDRQGYIWEP